MSQEDNSLRSKVGNFQKIADIVMGILYICIGIWILFAKHFGNFDITGPLAWCFSALLIFYGSFRLYRVRMMQRRGHEE